MIKAIAYWVWENKWIPLGPLAPHVLALMFGSKDYGKKD